MMNNKELKKKIVDIIVNIEWTDIFGIRHGGTADGLNNAIADALIAAGFGDVKDLQAQVDSLEITNIALQAGYDGAEEDRLYWVNKYKEAEHRAEVVERALKDIAAGQENLTIKVNGKIWSKEEIYKQWIKQAEKELAEEGKDG